MEGKVKLVMKLLYVFYCTTHMHSMDYAVKRYLSVRLSVHPSHAGIVCKRLYISTKFFRRQVAPPF